LFERFGPNLARFLKGDNVSAGKVCLYLSLLSIAASAEQSSEIENILEGRALQMQGSRRRRYDLSRHFARRNVSRNSNLASVQIDLGRMDEAARLCERAISILIKTAGEADSRVQRLRTELAALYLESGQDSTAEKLLRQTVAVIVGPGRMIYIKWQIG
jgi:hypothetical protein